VIFTEVDQEVRTALVDMKMSPYVLFGEAVTKNATEAIVPAVATTGWLSTSEGDAEILSVESHRRGTGALHKVE